MKKFIFCALALLVTVGAWGKAYNLALQKNNSTITLQDGDEVFGETTNDVTIKIAKSSSGSTHVILDGISLNYKWAVTPSGDNGHPGIQALGNARITLKGTNYVYGYGKRHAGIHIAKDCYLYIDEDDENSKLDSLFVYPGKNSEGQSMAAGIGANSLKGNTVNHTAGSCGHIVIWGGYIKANGSSAGAAIGGAFEASCATIHIESAKIEAYSVGAAAIGSGQHVQSNGSSFWSEVGDIEILSGDIRAYGGSYSAAIGGGCNGRCANITIANDVSKLYLSKGTGASYTIGQGSTDNNYNKLYVGTVTVLGTTYTNGIATSPYQYEKSSSTTPTPQPEPEPVCPAPTNVTASTITATTATISWTKGEDNTYSEVRYMKTTDPGYNYEDYLIGSSYTLYGLEPNTQYNVWVVGYCNGNLYSEQSAKYTFKTNALTPAAGSPCEAGKKVTDLNAINITQDQATLTWTPSAYDDYEWLIQFKMKGQQVPDSLRLALIPQKVVMNLQKDTTYGFRVKSICYDDDGVTEIYGKTWSDWYYFDTEGDPWDGDLAKVIKHDVTALHGMTIYGKLTHKRQVNIEDGATVYLDNADINSDGSLTSTSTRIAGLNCLGDAKIILDGENKITGIHNYDPAIYIPAGKTLIIDGWGSLLAKSNFAAGIGGARGKDCGNIIINGGTIEAYGGQNSSGASIGGTENQHCGKIIITGCVTSVFAANVSPNIIGAGKNGTCEGVFINAGCTKPYSDGQEYEAIEYGTGNVSYGWFFDPEAETEEGLDDVQSNMQTAKILRDGQLIIVVGDKQYNVYGFQIR